MTSQLSDVPSFGGAPAWVSAQALKKNTKKMLPHSCPIAPTPPHPLPHPKGGILDHIWVTWGLHVTIQRPSKGPPRGS